MQSGISIFLSMRLVPNPNPIQCSPTNVSDPYVLKSECVLNLVPEMLD